MGEEPDALTTAIARAKDGIKTIPQIPYYELMCVKMLLILQMQKNKIKIEVIPSYCLIISD